MTGRRHSLPYLTRNQHRAATLRRQNTMMATTSQQSNSLKVTTSGQSPSLTWRLVLQNYDLWSRNQKKIPVNILARKNKKHSVANAITVAGVTEALLIGQSLLCLNILTWLSTAAPPRSDVPGQRGRRGRGRPLLPDLLHHRHLHLAGRDGQCDRPHGLGVNPHPELKQQNWTEHQQDWWGDRWGW